MRLNDLIKKVKDLPIVVSGTDFACYQKSLIIKAYLEQFGVKAILMECKIQWSKTNIPQRLKRMIGDRWTSHIFLKVPGGIIEPVLDEFNYNGEYRYSKKFSRFRGLLPDRNERFYQELNDYLWRNK
jgi:hypothetical protein